MILDSDARRELLLRYKSRLVENQVTLRQQYQESQDVIALLKGRSLRVDAVLCDLWRELRLPEPMVLAAVGGYGRGELWPASDVDLLILLPEAPDPALAEQLEQLIGLFWDIGLEIGHSVRTVEDCLGEAEADQTVQTALVEARLLIGSAALFSRFFNAFRAQIDAQAFFHSKRVEQDERYLRFDESPYSLEPNCKDSPGGLRDLHTILWIAQAAGYGSCWRDLAEHGFITDRECAGLERRETFLKRVRAQLHLHVGRREDRLLFDYQTAVAEQLGFTDTATRRASELLMQEYYRAAKTVTQINTILLQNMGTAIFPPEETPPIPIDERFQNTHQLLDVVHEEVFNDRPGTILEAFLTMQQHSELKGMTARTIRALWRARVLIDENFRNDPDNKACFVALFKQPRGVLHELRRMNQFDLLGRYLPKFGAIVGQMQHDLFHVYTVDQHILRVLRNLRRFSEAEFTHEYPRCSELVSSFESPWVLYVAAIFHDIAKGRGGRHSELGAIDAQEFCDQHGLSPADSELIVWLVREHLVMSDFAQKRDTADPRVLADFAAIVGDVRHLTALYLFTVADIRATSPKVWNTWKGQLLEELFLQTRRLLLSGGQMPEKQGIIQDRQDEALRLLRYFAIPDDAHVHLWDQLDTAYFLRHSAEEICWHTRALYYRLESKKPVVKARINKLGEGIEVMAYTRDAPDLFARMVGCFSHCGFNIIDAKIHTTRNGYALDSFMMLDVCGRNRDRDLLAYIEAELTDQLADLSKPVGPLNGRVSRQVRHFPIRPTVSIQTDEKGVNYVLSVGAADRPGLLYTVASTLAENGANLHTAKIATLGERVEDTFLITGDDLADSTRRIRLETSLIERLEQ